MKFIHLSNVRLGLDEESQTYLPVSMRNIKEQNLLQIFSDARSVNVDLILITGDLFMHTPDLMEIMKADELFRFADDIPIVCLLSKKDPEGNKALLEYPWNCDITFIGEDTFSPFCLFRPKTEVYGCIKDEDLPELLRQNEAPTSRKMRILMLNDLPKDVDFLQYEGFDYVALGSEELRSQKITSVIYAPGRLVAESFTEETKHGYLFIDYDFRTKNGNCGFVASSAPEFLSVKIHATNGTSLEELQEAAKSAVALYGEGNIYRVIVNGENKEAVLERKNTFLSMSRIVSVVPGE